ncbi:hypothetical protein C0989_007571 [Termitomyces sp. Mn162]|nr:hypothetical protein C0989_007571 [Termitomyces sp. Mn162]
MMSTDAISLGRNATSLQPRLVFGLFSRKRASAAQLRTPSPSVVDNHAPEPPSTPSPPPSTPSPAVLRAYIQTIPPQTLHAYTLSRLHPSNITLDPATLHHLSTRSRPTEKRQRILTDLDRELPKEGWPVNPKSAVNRGLPNKTKSPSFLFQSLSGHRPVLSSFWQICMRNEKPAPWPAKQWYEENWGAERWQQFNIGAALITYIEIADVPDDFTKRAGRNTRGSGRGETELGSPQCISYDSKSGEYVTDKTSAGGTQSEPDKELYMDSEGKSIDTWTAERQGGFVDAVRLWLASQQDSDADDEIDRSIVFPRPDASPESSSKAADNENDCSLSETAPIELSDSSSEYVGEETGSERGTRDSPLRLRSHQSSR